MPELFIIFLSPAGVRRVRVPTAPGAGGCSRGNGGTASRLTHEQEQACDERRRRAAGDTAMQKLRIVIFGIWLILVIENGY